MGRVYKARHTRLAREVAVKVIRKEKLKHPAAEARFNNEVEALGKMRHPNVVDVFNADKVGDTHYYEMELIDGTDLTKIVRERGPLPVYEACDYIRQAALGLHHAYEKGLVHRDIKPSNMIVNRNNRQVKLVDLGLARLMEPEMPNDEVGRITQEGFVIGTPDFLAPEQARNPMAVDIRADIYALGGTLFYILTGKVPFDGANPTEKLLKHCTDPPPRLLQYRPDAPPQLEQIIHWCMAKQIEARPQTPLELALALQPFCPLAQPAIAGPSSGRFQATAPSGVPSGQHPVAPAVGVPSGHYPHPAASAPIPGSGPHPIPPGYPYPAAPGYHFPVPPGYPAPTQGFPPGFPMPAEDDPNRSSQVFKLPPQTTSEDPIRRRGELGFPWGTVLLGFGALLVIGILGFATYQAFLRPAEPPLDAFTNSQQIKMLKLDGGKFRMGSSETDLHRAEELPQHEVTIKGPFLMAATEVSHQQFLKVMGFSPSKSPDKAAKAQNRPVEYVTWDEANDFCRKLTESEKEQKWMRKGWAYRLPTEAEWEYAARAGTDTSFAFGDHIVFEKQALFRPMENDLIGMGAGFKPPDFPQEVGKTEANGFGLHDMHGNVAEWCLDWYKPGYPVDGQQDNPTGPSSGDKRVVRGGSFKDPATGVRSASRTGIRPGERNDNVGFRIVYAPLQK
jgi:formylglycine-generating enzyme required for sulfatase activity/tRNA A-37 threonylcarbamoyl transferase component Bud32